MDKSKETTTLASARNVLKVGGKASDDVETLKLAQQAFDAKQFDKARGLLAPVLASQNFDGQAHFLEGRMCVSEKNFDTALWHGVCALSAEEPVASEQVRKHILDVVHSAAAGEATHDLVHGVIKSVEGNMNGALKDFQQALSHSTRREEKLRCYMFICLTTIALEKYDAAIKCVHTMLEYDPNSVISYLWLADIYRAQGKQEEAAEASEKASSILIEAEASANAKAPNLAADGYEKVCLRTLISESKSEILAPIRALLVADPGASISWTYVRDSIFHFDSIFGPSKPAQMAQSLSKQVEDGVAAKRVKERILLKRPTQNPVGTSETLATSFEIEKIFASNVRPALIRLYDEDGKPMEPRMVWKSGDDLRRDLFVQVYFEIFNLIWSETLGEEVFEAPITYGILPLVGTARLGFLEFVEDTESQASFDWQRSDPEVWMPSFAASMTAGYCVGAEDRHARNILIQGSERVFQIDFGYILGEQPGLGLGAGPALPFSKHVSRALTADQRSRFIEYSCLLYDILGRYRSELAGLAARFCEVMRLSVFLTNPRSFMERRLASTVMFRHEISRAERDVGRMRKEYLALAWVSV